MSGNRKTDWNKYYNKEFKITSFTRKITERKLLALMAKYSINPAKLKIAELGGANSCFYDAIKEAIKPEQYHVIDNNDLGLKIFEERTKNDKGVSINNCDVLDLTSDKKFDLVYSVGLIEHFTVEETAKVIKAHFDLLDRQGIVIITFPTPTLLYRLARFCAELIRIWIFHDERPIKGAEVENIVKNYGKIVYNKINWVVILTQRIVVIKKI